MRLIDADALLENLFQQETELIGCGVAENIICDNPGDAVLLGVEIGRHVIVGVKVLIKGAPTIKPKYCQLCEDGDEYTPCGICLKEEE